MTLVMVCQEAPERWWVVSDSRLTQPAGSGLKRLTDAGAKILELPVTLFRPTVGDPFGEAIAKTTLGFAYSGSTLVALQAYAAVLPLWRRLQSTPHDILPSVEDFVRHLAQFVKAYYLEIQSPCQCILLGNNHGTGSAEAWVIEAGVFDTGDLSPKADVSVRRIDDTDAISTFGTGGKAANLWIERFKEGTGYAYPKSKIRNFIRDIVHEDAQDVGGAVQIGMLIPNGFELCFDVAQPTAGRPLPYMSYRGFEMNSISKIGPCITIMRGVT